MKISESASLKKTAESIDEARVDEARVDEARVDEARVDEARVDEARVDEARVDEARVDDTRVGEARVDDTRVDEARVDDTRVGDTRFVETPVLDGIMLSLHPLSLASLPRLYYWRNKASVRKFMAQRNLISKSEHCAWFNKLHQNPQDHAWEIIENSIQKPVGFCQIKECATKQKGEWGFYIGREKSRMSGVGAECAFRVLAFGFSDLKYTSIQCHTRHSNISTIAMHRHFGFHHDLDRQRREDPSGTSPFHFEILDRESFLKKKDHLEAVFQGIARKT